MLTEKQKTEIVQFVTKTQDSVDIEDLRSAKYDSNPYGVEPELVGSSGGFDWDDDELWNASCELAVKWLKADGLGGYFNWDEIDDDNDGVLLNEVVDYIHRLEV